MEQSLSSGDGELPVGPPDTPASGGRSGSDQAAIGASIAAALVFVLLLIALAYIMHTRRQRSTAKVGTFDVYQLSQMNHAAVKRRASGSYCC